MSKKTIVTTNGKRGGNLVGKPHKDKQGNDVGGIKAVVTDANNRPVELEGGEVIINKEASKKHWKELSRINQSAGGGVPIEKPIDPHDEDPEEYAKGGKIEFNPNQLPNKWILKYAQHIKKNYPEIWKKGGNIYGNQAFINLERVAERGYWLDSEEWFYIKWRSFVARHKGDFRIAGVIAMLKWVDKVDRGWQYMKNLIEDEIKKLEAKKSTKEKGGWSVSQEKRMSKGGDVVIDETIANNPMSQPKVGMAIVRTMEANEFFPNVYYVLDVIEKNGEIDGVQYGIPNGFSFSMPIREFKSNFQPATEKQVNRSKNTSKTLFENGGELEKGIKTEMGHKETIDKFKRKRVSDRQVATSIAKDHLKEDPNYYTKLLEMEGKMAKGGTTARQQAKIGYTMREFKGGKLKTSYGETVTDEKQALAIALSKAGIEKKADGGTIQDPMTISEMENFYYSEKGKITVDQMPNYITDGTIVYEKIGFKKNNGLKKGMCIVSTYNKYNKGAEFWRIEGFVKERKFSNPNYVKIDGDSTQEILANIIEKYDTMKELLEAMNCKNLSELEKLSNQSRNQNLAVDFSILFRDITDNGISPNLGNYYYISDGKWARGGGAEPLSFIEYLPLESGENPNDLDLGNSQRIDDITHDKLNDLYDKNNMQGANDIAVGDKGFYNGKQRVPIEVIKVNNKNIYFRNEETGEIKRSERKNFERLFDSTSSIDSNVSKPPTSANYDFDNVDDGNVSSGASQTSDIDEKIEKLRKKIDAFQAIINNPKSEKQRNFAKGKMKEAREELEKLLAQKHGSVQNYVHDQLNKKSDDSTPKRRKKDSAKDDSVKVDYYAMFKQNNEVIEMSENETLSVQLGRFAAMVDEDRLMKMENVQDLRSAIDKLG
jgi:hypothetical protein